MPSKITLSRMLDAGSKLTLDGALATELEARGCNLEDPLWSAKVLLEQPQLIKQVHRDYFDAGATVAITASYQATPRGFRQRGIGEAEALGLVALSVRLADDARREYLAENPEAGPLLIAGSVGPYGAYLADGSEYRGDYTLSRIEFMEFHRPRIAALVEAGVDLLACETLPSVSETKALLALVEEFNVEAWFSFTLRDGEHISDGTTLANVARLCATQPRVVAIGVNCVPLELVSPSLRALRKVTSIPLIAYPNSGECYDALTKTWTPGPAVGGADGKQPASIAEGAGIWQELGARLIGGCCRTTPQDIAGIGRYM
ncbi:homocysteine S-methyltransferase [Arthrobacter bambusae]|jgi:homocysteine S-methyltransferase|uniref:S-methylmethionine:homocysteine methyltransferase n=1 Tax=Arthrobacter bambusae TaxID=1338426 RepID=A0AAW8DMI4_9MICC|nr:homocysteine S-methyltransferase [Arthrobacter bambusae]MDP9907538.1 homocysteine S-methyltransferase [Arthrobacter bambusae]MDQ0131743.1 homocysteine S-methyltransferase [Arthrobacter bambusae]MDQ0183155.1 homocysteine S-methyltransferase [Arthrobacter bambusae]